MKRSEFFLAGLVAGLMILGPATGLAQPAEERHDEDPHHGPDHRHSELEEVVVRATPLNRNLVELSQSATVLSGQELQNQLAASLGDTLARIPGLSNASFGENVGRPVIRGLQGQRVGVLSNNMSSGDASAVSQDHAVSIEPFLADQIEVLRGPSTLLYGSGAIGGVVNVVTHTIPVEPAEQAVSGRAIAQADSAADQRMAGARIDLSGERLALHANAFYRRSDDYEIPGAAELYPEDEAHEEHHESDGDEAPQNGILENSFFDNEGGALGASWIGAQWRLGASWTAYDSNYGIPGASHHHEEHGDTEAEAEEPGHDEDEFVTIDLASDRWDAELVGQQPFRGFAQLTFRAAGIGYTHTEFEGEAIGTVFDSDTLDSRLELRHEPWGRLEGAFGLQYQDIDFSAVGEEAFVPDSQTETTALFWVESAEFAAWRLDTGVRYEDVAVRRASDGALSDRSDPTRTFRPLSLSAGAIWHAQGNSHFSFTLARSERAPTAQELFAYGPHVASQIFEIGNPDLRIESNVHGELGYRVHGGRLTGSLVVYADRFDDYIYQANSAAEEEGLPVRLWSQRDADFIGGELELRYDLGHRRSGHWQLFGFYDTVRGELAGGENVPLMPPTRIGLGADWDLGDWAASLAWIHASSHDRVAEYETPTPGYDLVNAEVSWRFAATDRSEWVAFLKARNLLDEDIRNSTSYLKDRAPQAGRNVLLGLRARF
ncbi:MAG: TonB-dependent receptor [Xanthomonadales bacterium]